MRVKYSIKNCITFFINYIITLIFLFINQTIFIKLLGIEYVGLNGIFSNVLTVLNLFELGFGSAVTYNLYKYIKNNKKDIIKSIMKYYKKIYNTIALIILLVGLLIIPFLKYIINDVTIDINIYVVYIIFLLTNVSSYLCSYKRNLMFSYQRNYVINIIHIICIVILNIIQIIILYLTRNYYLFLVLNIIFTLLENIIISIKVNNDYPYIKDKNVSPISKKLKQDITSRVKALFIHKAAGSLSNGIDSIIISSFFGIKILGLYSSYYYIIHAVYNLFSNIIKATSASVGNLLVEKDYEKNYIVFKKIEFLNIWIAIFTSTCLFLLIEPFIKLWIGSNYLLSYPVLVLLIINFYQKIMRSTYIVFKDSAGIWIEDRYIPIIKSIINIVSSIILLKIFGLVGVFIGTFISSLTLWLYSYPKFVYKKLFNKNYCIYYKEMLKNIVLFILIISITYLISNIFMINSALLKLLINIIICITIPNILLFLIYKNTLEFNYYINLIKEIFKKGKKEYES